MLKFIGPSFSASPSLYGRASSLPDLLPVTSLARLASCSLSSPDGDAAIEEQWFNALACLTQSVTLPHKKGMITRQAMREALPLLESEGLKPGTALRQWCGAAAVAGAAVVVAQSPVEKPSQAGVHKQDCPEWFKAKLRQIQFLDRVKEGAAAVGKVLVPGKDFSASAVVRALEKLGVIPEGEDLKRMGEAVREYYQEIEWKSRAPGDEMAATLVEHYRRGEAIAKQADDAVASKARATMRGV